MILRNRHLSIRVSGTAMQELAYRYDRDGLGRLVSKKLPGAETREVVSDRYLFGGKEYLSEDGRDEYYFLARNYIPSIPRFDRHDPKAEKYYSVSPYLPFAGNPACVIDPNGEDAIITIIGKVITITANIILDDTIDKSLVEIYQKKINETWGSVKEYEQDGQKYKVKWNIKVRKQAKGEEKDYNGVNNYFSDAKNRTDYPNRSCVDKETMHDGYLRTTPRPPYESLEADNPSAHETGHLLGLGDTYNTANGDIPKEWKGNIMAEPTDASVSVDSRNMAGILKNAVSIHNFKLSIGSSIKRVLNKYNINTVDREFNKTIYRINVANSKI